MKDNIIFTEEVLTAEEAASFLKMHPVTLRRKAVTGEIKGSKRGKSWLFIKSDLLEDIRKDYKCSGKEKMEFGTPIFPSQEKSVLSGLASQRTKHKRKNSTTQ